MSDRMTAYLRQQNKENTPYVSKKVSVVERNPMDKVPAHAHVVQGEAREHVVLDETFDDDQDDNVVIEEIDEIWTLEELESMTKAELQEIAETYEVGVFGFNKSDIVDALWESFTNEEE